MEGGDLKRRGAWGCGWPKSRASRLADGVGVDVPETVGEGCAMGREESLAWKLRSEYRDPSVGFVRAPLKDLIMV